jgi:phage-related protein
MAVPVSELQKIAPSAIIELFQLELNVAQHGTSDIYRFHAGTNAVGNNGNLVWAGNSYLAFPIEAEGFEYNGTSGSLPRPKLRASNILSTITTLLLTLPNGLEGAKVIRIRTLARYLDAVNFPAVDYLLAEDSFALMYEDSTFIYQEVDNPLGTPDPTAEFPREIYFIDRKSAENREVVEFELASAFDLVGVRAPKRQCISNICQWKYRSAECGYTGTAYFTANDVATTAGNDVCGKKLNSCRIRFGFAADISRVGKTDRLFFTNQTLASGSSLVSSNGWYQLVVQSDGNLVVYSKGGVAVWNSGTQGNGPVYLVAQADGNLVLYRVSDNVAVWDTATVGANRSFVVIQGDGNLVIYLTSGVVVYTSGYSSLFEPLTVATLPFGSYPAVGSFVQ